MALLSGIHLTGGFKRPDRVNPKIANFRRDANIFPANCNRQMPTISSQIIERVIALTK
jgi:hypothetical protein